MTKSEIKSLPRVDDYLNDVEIIPITYKEWKKSNGGYIGKTTKAYKL